MDYNYLTTIYRSILSQIYVFLVLFTIFHFDLKKFISKNCKYIFFLQKFVQLGENTSICCSRIIVHSTFFSKIVNEYDREIPQSQTADNPMAPRGRAAQPSRDTRKTK